MFRSSVLSLDTGRETDECPAQSCPHYSPHFSSQFRTSAAGVLLLVLAFSRGTIVPFHIKAGLNHRTVLPLLHLCFSTIWKLRSHDAPLLIHGCCASSDRTTEPAAHPNPEGAVEDPGCDGGSGQKQAPAEQRQQ